MHGLYCLLPRRRCPGREPGLSILNICRGRATPTQQFYPARIATMPFHAGSCVQLGSRLAGPSSQPGIMLPPSKPPDTVTAEGANRAGDGTKEQCVPPTDWTEASAAHKYCAFLFIWRTHSARHTVETSDVSKPCGSRSNTYIHRRVRWRRKPEGNEHLGRQLRTSYARTEQQWW